MYLRLKNIKRFFATFAILLLLLPVTYQSYHELTVHHEKFICKATNDTHHIHKYHKDCPIESFKYFSFVKTNFTDISQNILVYRHSIISFYDFVFVDLFNNNQQLRAPPIVCKIKD